MVQRTQCFWGAWLTLCSSASAQLLLVLLRESEDMLSPGSRWVWDLELYPVGRVDQISHLWSCEQLWVGSGHSFLVSLAGKRDSERFRRRWIMSLDNSWKMLAELEKVFARLGVISRKPLQMANHTELLDLDPMINSRNSAVGCQREKWCEIDVATKMLCRMGLKCPSAVFAWYPLALWISSHLGAVQSVYHLWWGIEKSSTVWPLTARSSVTCDDVPQFPMQLSFVYLHSLFYLCHSC